jgi:sec-independent protein translocase protein TatC
MASTLLGPRRDEDLFEDTTMTFGEHLEELRGALFKALAGLVIGTLLGMLVGNYVVDLIKAPMESALERYYRKNAEEEYAKFEEHQKAEGLPIEYSNEQIKTILDRGDLLYEVRYIHPQFLRSALGLPAANLPESLTAETLVPILEWHKISSDKRIHLSAFGASEAFSIWLKASLIVGALLSSPWVFYHIWAFVAAGLYPHERKYVHVFLPFSLGLFLLGAATAYIFVFKPVLDFLFGFNHWMQIDPDPRISEWLSFVLMLPLGFGISFQLPLVMLFLERIGVFDVTGYLQKWRLAVLVIFILSAVLTPADPYSLLLMALPLCVLYFGGIGLCRMMPRRKLLDDAVS